jgi:hypothetical protein
MKSVPPAGHGTEKGELRITKHGEDIKVLLSSAQILWIEGVLAKRNIKLSPGEGII